jgi:phosphoribosylformylglycinamidine synthase
MNAQIIVRLKKSVLDPQGKAILGAVQALGFQGVDEVRQGKVFDVTLKTNDKAQAEKELSEIGKKLLANTVIEDFEIKLL